MDNNGTINTDSDIVIHDDDPIQVMTIKQKIKKIHKSKKKVKWNYANIEPLEVLSNTPKEGLQEGFQEGLSMDNTTCEDDNDFMGCDNTKAKNNVMGKVAAAIESFYAFFHTMFYYIALGVSMTAIYWVDNITGDERGNAFQYRNRNIRKQYEMNLGFALNPRMLMPSKADVKRVQLYVELFFSAAISCYFVYNWMFLLSYHDDVMYPNGVPVPEISIDNAEKAAIVALANDTTGGITLEGLLRPFLNKKTIRSAVQFVDSKTGADPLVENKVTKPYSTGFYLIFLIFFKYAWVFITVPYYLLFVELRKLCKQKEFKFLNETISVPNLFTKQMGFIFLYVFCIVLTFYSSATLKNFILNLIKGDITKSPALLTIGGITTMYFIYSLFSVYNPVQYLLLIPFFGVALIFLLYIIIMIYSPILASILLFFFFFSHSFFGGLMYGGRNVFRIPEMIDDFTRMRTPVLDTNSYTGSFVYIFKMILKFLFENIFYLVLAMIMIVALVDYFLHVSSKPLKYGMIIFTALALALLYFIRYEVNKMTNKRKQEQDYPYVDVKDVAEALSAAVKHEANINRISV
jgi:membrane protein implicated in regulation of membrane protease activity